MHLQSSITVSYQTQQNVFVWWLGFFFGCWVLGFFLILKTVSVSSLCGEKYLKACGLKLP